MAARDEIVTHANALLEIERFPEFAPQGLQVIGADDVQRIACGVSSSLELFEKAVALGAELVLVHHGLFWRNEPLVVDERLRGRLETLFRGNVSLVAYHLALDAHPTLGNNAQLADRIGAVPVAGRRGTAGETWFPPPSSGCPDSNWGPLRPERSALPGCATPRAPERVPQ